MTHRFHMVDVFAERRYSGNPLAVVIIDSSREILTADTMLRVAAETNYSETTFVTPVPEANGGYRLRIFTPASEIAFAGHPILGTATVLRRFLGLETSAPLRLNLQVGQVGITFEVSTEGYELAWFVAPPMSLGPVCAPDSMARALGISPADIDSTSPVQQVSAMTAAMMVPLRSRDALRRCKLDLDAYAGLAAQGFPPLVYVFCNEPDNPKNHLRARFFFEAHGVREDAASGNAAAFLGAYLLAHGLVPASGFLLRIEQGHEIRRPSLVMLRGRVAAGSPQISVGGQVIPTVHGVLT
jgi:trans-2,3-dihydro-3-hydroxyanthranilate isomerase